MIEMTDKLADYQHGHDGLVRSLSVSPNTAKDRIEGRVVLAVMRMVDGTEAWFELHIEFSEVLLSRLDPAWLVGGGCVMYDGGRLFVGPEHALKLNLDPGVAWAVAGPKPEQESSALIIGVGTVREVRT